MQSMEPQVNRFKTPPQGPWLFRVSLCLKGLLCGQERMIIVVVLLFSLAMVGLLWQMLNLSDDLARGLVLQGTELQSVALEEFRQYYSSEIVARVAHMEGLEVTHDYRAKKNA